jgi:two-component system response regulator DegU
MPKATNSHLRVYIVESRELVRAGLRLLLDEHPCVRVVGEARDSARAAREVAGLRPDVVVVADALRGESGLDLLPRLAGASGGARAVVLTDSHDPEVHRRALGAGAAAVLMSHASAAKLFEVLFASADARGPAKQAARNGVGTNRLTRREAEIAELVRRGLRNREIGERLFISEATVRRHLTSIFRKTGLQGRVALALQADERGENGGVS